MSRDVVTTVAGRLILLVGAIMCAPLGLALVDGDGRAASAYGLGVGLTVLYAAALLWVGRGAPKTLHGKDAIGAVVLTWLSCGLLGAVPFVVEGAIPSPAAALFEAVSGFTATGATVATDIDGLSRATNLWRCEMHWIGGMGIVVLFVAIFPTLGVGGKNLFRSEVPGPITEGLRPQIRHTALALWWIYAALTSIAIAAFVLLGMPLFDAVCHGFSTLATGGFSSRSASIAAYDSPAIHWTVSAFMLIGGINFGLYYGALRGRWRDLWRNSELRFYLVINALVAVVIAVLIMPRHDGFVESLQYSTFQTLAISTTTGFATEDFDAYPDMARMLLFMCMFMGGCAGSTSGGIKASRVFVLIRLAGAEVRALLRPHDVTTVRLGDSNIPRAVAYGILVFVTTYALILALVVVSLTAMKLDFVTALSAGVACLSTVGPGLAGVGPMENFAFIPDAGKLLLSFCMLAGRLEIFVLLAVFNPECWRR